VVSAFGVESQKEPFVMSRDSALRDESLNVPSSLFNNFVIGRMGYT